MTVLQFEMRPGYDAGAVRHAIRVNMARGLRHASAHVWHTGDDAIQICGNGPSLRQHYPVGRVAALNNAWRTLGSFGHVPQFIIAADPRIENAAWFKGAPDEPIYLIASRCHPKVFDTLAGKQVFIWHCDGDEEASLNLRGRVPGGSTIATKAMSLLSRMGFSKFSLYGCESCVALDGLHHATPQPWNDREDLRPYQVGERMFVAAPWMAAQAQEIVDYAREHRFSQTIKVECGGLTGALLDAATLNLSYDFDVSPANYDFIAWLCNAECHRESNGYARIAVRFRWQGRDHDPGEPILLEPERRRELFEGVCRPALRLFGAIEGGDGSSEARFTHVMRPTCDYVRAGGELPVMRPMPRLEPGCAPIGRMTRYVITLREAKHWPARNSDFEAWVAFGRQLAAGRAEVIVVRDTAQASEEIEGLAICPEASTDLAARLDLYRSADMNFFVSNGPATLAIYTRDVSYICFMKSPRNYPCHAPNWVETNIGIPYGGQFPWASERQRLVWAEDTAENITSAWAEMQPHLEI